MKIKDDLSSIDIVIERAKLIGLPVILTTSTDKSDDELIEIAKNHKIEFFRGALENKLKRWYDCFNKFDIDFAIEIDGDDLCYSYDLGKQAVDEIKLKNTELLTTPPNAMVGLFTYALTKNAITKLYRVAKNEQTNTDVITKFIEKANLKVNYISTKEYESNEQMRLTLDYEEDLQFFRELYVRMDVSTNTKEIIDYLRIHPELCRINYHRHQDYLRNQAKFNAKIH